MFQLLCGFLQKRDTYGGGGGGGGYLPVSALRMCEWLLLGKSYYCMHGLKNDVWNILQEEGPHSILHSYINSFANIDIRNAKKSTKLLAKKIIIRANNLYIKYWLTKIYTVPVHITVHCNIGKFSTLKSGQVECELPVYRYLAEEVDTSCLHRYLNNGTGF